MNLFDYIVFLFVLFVFAYTLESYFDKKFLTLEQNQAQIILLLSNDYLPPEVKRPKLMKPKSD